LITSSSDNKEAVEDSVVDVILVVTLTRGFLFLLVVVLAEDRESMLYKPIGILGRQVLLMTTDDAGF
jgi:hypothetical protein